MNARRSSTKKRNRLKTGWSIDFDNSFHSFALILKNFLRTSELTTCSNLNQHCDFCVLSFPTRAELKVHVLTHFKKTTCMKTQKTLLLIVDDWFELHINDNCCTEHSPNTFEATANLVCIDDEVTVKKEEKIEENDTTASCIINDVVGDVPTKIEIDSGTEYFDGNLSDSSSEFSVEKIEPKVKKSKQVKNDDASLVTTKAKKNPTRIKQKTKKLNGNDKVIDRKTKPTKCRICKQKFPADGIIAHLQSRHVPRILPIPKCETCGKTFSTPGNLRSHQYLHAERGRYICSYCGKEFVRNANLKEHINLHTVGFLSSMIFRLFITFGLYFSGCTTLCL